MSSQLENSYEAATGRQGHIKGGGVANDLSFNTLTKLTGVALQASTDYYYRIPTAGSNTLHVVLKPSSITGTAPTITAYATLSDGITQKGAASTLTQPSGTTQVVDAITTLMGERFWVLKIAVPGGGGITFSQAEYTTL